jgi:tetratricopeptide (TPR) repeat protein
MNVFISHTHDDHGVARALAGLIETLFFGRVKPQYSTSKELDEAPAPGEDWYAWIVEKVRDAEVAIILLTPGSIQKPWVIWEAGAVGGAAVASSADKRVIPIAFALSASDLPTVFGRNQVVNGTDEGDIKKLVTNLLDQFQTKLKLTNQELMNFGERRADAIRDYLARINELILTLPLMVTESAIQEWLGRLDQLVKENRFSEVDVMENWIDVAFGRVAKDKPRPLDVRIHRRLGDLYLSAGRPSDAARQFGLARQLAPRDIFILRRLGKALLDQKDTTGAKQVIDAVETLDPKAFEINAENAALKARLFEETNNLIGAREVLEKGFSNSSSYYLGDRLGQILIRLNENERAKAVYTQVQRILNDLREKNVWTHATALTAAIVCGDEATMRDSIRAIRALKPTRGELESIERGAGKVLTAVGRDHAVVDELRKMET